MAVAAATIIEWTVKEGEWVEEHQVVVVIEVEEIRSDVEAPAAGFVHILLEQDRTAPVGKMIGLIAESKEELEALQKETPKELSTEAVEVMEALKFEAAPSREAVADGRSEERIRISPVARKMADKHVIDITKIVGTGPGGRITRQDIEKAIAAKETAPAEVAAQVATHESKKVKMTIPLKGMRAAIAEHMHQSLSVAAQLTAIGEIDMTQMVKLRKDLVDQERAIGTRITYTDIFVFAVAKALRDHPVINSSLIANEIKVWEDINISVAVALDDGLIVPVVKNADKKSLVEISQTVRILAEKAREGKLVSDEVAGGTFTITNLGALGGGWNFETPIINQPESAILRTGGITERAVVRDGQIVIRPIMTYSFTYDHRVIDGAVAAKFVRSLIMALENPSLLLA